jgi:hypothetical protein
MHSRTSQERFEWLRSIGAEYTGRDAVADHARSLEGVAIDNMRELGYYDRNALHNLKTGASALANRGGEPCSRQ